jgi:hypothetical protein
MPRHDVNKDATAETRRKGALAAAQAKRVKRVEAEEAASEALSGLIQSALAKLEALLDSDDDHVRFRAVKEVLDRVCGRPAQAVALEMGWPKGFDPTMLSDDELDQLKQLLLKSQPRENGQ